MTDDDRFHEIDRRLDALVRSQEATTAAIKKLTEDTQGVVDLYQNARGVVTVGVAIQKLGLWMIKWPVVGAGIYAIWDWLDKHS